MRDVIYAESKSVQLAVKEAIFRRAKAHKKLLEQEKDETLTRMEKINAALLKADETINEAQAEIKKFEVKKDAKS